VLPVCVNGPVEEEAEESGQPYNTGDDGEYLGTVC